MYWYASASISHRTLLIFEQAASWDPNIEPPENSTIALVDISNFLSPIAADTALLYNTILDDLALHMTFRQITLSAAVPCILKIGRLLDSLTFIQDRIRLVLEWLSDAESLELQSPFCAGDETRTTDQPQV